MSKDSHHRIARLEQELAEARERIAELEEQVDGDGSSCATEPLKTGHVLLDTLLDKAPCLVFVKDVDGRYLYGNTTFFNSIDRPTSQVLGRSDAELYSSEAAEVFARGDKAVLDSGEQISEEVSFSLETLKGHWVTTKFPMTNDEGSTLGVCGVSLDVTELREAEAGLRKLSSAVEQCPVSIVITGTDNRIEYVNPHFCKVCGYSREELLGTNPSMLKSGLHDEAFYEAMWVELSTGKQWSGEICNRSKSGELYWENATISPVFDKKGEVTHYIGVKEDITETRRLRILERDVERIVRHDLKSPLMSAVTIPKLLKRADNMTSRQVAMLEELEELGYRTLNMINLSQALYAMERGTYVLSKDTVNLVEVMERVMEELDRSFRARDVSVAVLVDDQPPAADMEAMVDGDPMLLHSMITNLIKNALEASEAGDRVNVTCVSRDCAITITNPAPVPKQIRSKFFEKYATSGKQYGAGLGTYSARLIAENHGGEISMETGEDGTVVKISLPCAGSCEV